MLAAGFAPCRFLSQIRGLVFDLSSQRGVSLLRLPAFLLQHLGPHAAGAGYTWQLDILYPVSAIQPIGHTKATLLATGHWLRRHRERRIPIDAAGLDNALGILVTDIDKRVEFTQHLYERQDLAEGERKESGLLSSRALSNDTRLPRKALIARPLRHFGGVHAHAPLHEFSCLCPSVSPSMHAPQCISFHAHALLFSCSVQVGKN